MDLFQMNNMDVNVTNLNRTGLCSPHAPYGNYCHGGLDRGENSGDYYHLKVVADVLNIVITPSLCIFGCIGNIINLIVLSKIRMRMRKVDGGKEGVTHTGLILLAVSDLLFCLSMCPRGIGRMASTMSFFEHRSFALYYQAYGTGLVTTFILTSTWVTVAMAVLRYVGICHPLMTRRMDSRVYGRIAYASVIIISAVINLPAFWQYKIETFNLGPGNTAYLIDIGLFDKESLHGKAFLWVRAFYAVFIPAGLLTFCNLSLIRTLQQSYRMRRACRVQDSASRNSSRITLLLVVLVVMFIVLVFPSEIMDFCTENIKMSMSRTETFLTFRAFANVLQVLNFAVNFILYCTMNVHFRSTMKDLFLCGKCGRNSYDRKQFSMMGRSMDNSCATGHGPPTSIVNMRLTDHLSAPISELNGDSETPGI